MLASGVQNERKFTRPKNDPTTFVAHLSHKALGHLKNGVKLVYVKQSRTLYFYVRVQKPDTTRIQYVTIPQIYTNLIKCPKQIVFMLLELLELV